MLTCQNLAKCPILEGPGLHNLNFSKKFAFFCEMTQFEDIRVKAFES